MAVKLPSLEEMLNAGVHFGHKKQRSYSKAKKYIFCLRDGINVIDLEKTQILLKEALDYLTKSTKEGKVILFVGTKRQAKKIVEDAAKKTGMPYITHRWMGGMLTNFETVRKSIKKLEELEKKKSSDEYSALTKQEKAKIEEEVLKLHKIFDGIINMDKMPDILFIVDAVHEDIAVLEALTKEIPIVAICDTDANPDRIDYPIIANDDAVKSLQMIIGLVENAILEGKSAIKSQKS